MSDAWENVCVCVRACVRTCARVCVCVHVCVCVRKLQREIWVGIHVDVCTCMYVRKMFQSERSGSEK